MKQALALSLLLVSITADARELAGVKLEDSVQVGATTLPLNGIALRKKALFKVYVGGLYLTKASNDPTAIIAADEPKALTMQFVRDVDKSKLIDAYKDGFAANAKGKITQAQIDKLIATVTDVKEGERIQFVYEPGKGATLRFPGNKTVSFEGKSFADAYLLLYLGAEPPTDDLKNGLLGKS